VNDAASRQSAQRAPSTSVDAPTAGESPAALDLDVAIIACDNERTIRRTIESVRAIAQRVIVVDSGSTDATLDICRELGAEVIHHEFEGHVKQKQFALDQCSATWALSLDSDESPDEPLSRAIVEAVQNNDSKIAGYEMNRRIFFLGDWLRYTFQPEWRLRLVKRDQARWTGYDPHDKMEVNGATARLSGVLRHDSWENVAHLLRSQIRHGIHAAESYHQLGRRGGLTRLIISPLGAILKQLVLRLAVLDGWRGIVCAVAAGIGVAAKYMRLIELCRRGV